MAVLTAYILIETVVGTSSKVTDSLRGIQEVLEVDRVTGPYDVIARVETGDIVGLSVLLHDKVQRMSGVTKTLTCVVAIR